MDTEKGQTITSCRKKKNEEATFLEDLKDHIDEFIHASMDEHKTCFKKTVQKVCLVLKQENNYLHAHVNHCCGFFFFFFNFRCSACPRLLQNGTLMPQKKLRAFCPCKQLCKIS
ncbi:hypothetical protein Fmac_025088 [Flemingia macrophylla]|uniref:Uncharacterized protein n=1 Tax=Flemingia macrophylla TaxID=520843 RepID=A0ABD1LSZ2_9FABA